MGTGAGQWAGRRLRVQLMGLRCTIFWVRSTLREKPIRGEMMRLDGEVVHESPATDRSRAEGARGGPESIGTLGGPTGEALALASEDSEHASPSGVARTRSCSTRPSSARRPSRSWPRWASSRLRHRVHGRRIDFGGVTLPFLGAAKDPGGRSGSSPSSRPRAEATRGRYLYDLSDALARPDHQDLLARQHLRAATGLSPANCGTTAPGRCERHVCGRLHRGDGHRPGHVVPGRHAVLRD